MWSARATAVLVELLLRRGTDRELADAEAVIERLAGVSAELGLVVHELWLVWMRALLARARDDEPTYRDLRERYRRMASELGFEGHTAMAETL